MDITKQVKLNLQNPGNPAIVHAKQGDKDSRILEITLYDGATAYEIPAGATVQIEGTKPDKTSFMYGGTITDGVVSVTLQPQVLTVAGIVPADIVLYSGTQRLSSFRINIVVQEKSFDDEATPSEDYIEPFSELVDELMRVKGAPLVANTAAGMTDTERIYVYTGSETGYVNGNWYYYNGSSWQSGGVYNSQGIGNDILDMIYRMYPLESDSGDVAAFDDSADGIPIKKLIVNIEGYQDGTGDPALDNPRAFVPVDAITVTQRNKNIFVQNSATTINNGITFSKKNNGTFTLYGTATANASMSLGNVSLPIGARVIYSGSPAGTGAGAHRMRYRLRDFDGVWGSWVYINSTDDVTINIGDHNGINLNIYVSSGTVIPDGGVTYKPMLRFLGTDEYVPALTDDYEYTFPTPIFKGTLDVLTGVLTDTHEVRVMDGVTTGKMFTSKSSVATINEYYFADNDVGTLGYPTSAGYVEAADLIEHGFMCSHALFGTGKGTANVVMADLYIGNNSGNPRAQPRIRLLTSSTIQTVADVNAWLASEYANGTPVTYVLERKTPVTYQLTPSEVCSFINECAFFVKGYNLKNQTLDVTIRADLGKWLIKHRDDAVDDISLMSVQPMLQTMDIQPVQLGSMQMGVAEDDE